MPRITDQYPLCEVRYRKEPEGGLLFDPEEGAYHPLNQTGAKLVEMANGSKSIDEIIGEICKNNSMDREVIEEKVIDFFKDEDKGYISLHDTSQQISKSFEFSDNEFSITMPRGVILLVTNKCNLACSHCLYEAGDELEDEMSTEEIKLIIDKLHDAGVFEITFSGGEPLIRDDILELATYAKELGFSTGIISNGILIEEDNYQKIADIFDSIVISLDGSEKDVHENLRGEGTWEDAIAGCELMSETDVPLSINTTLLTETSMEEVEKRIELGIELEASTIAFDVPLEIGRGEDERFRTPLSKRRELFKFFKRKAPEYSSEIRVHPPEEFQGIQIEGDATNCGIGDIITINSSGVVFPCPLLIFDEFEIGNIRHASLQSLLHSSEKFRELIDIHVGDLDGCQDCNLADKGCPGGCRARAYLEHGDVYGDNLCARKEL